MGKSEHIKGQEPNRKGGGSGFGFPKGWRGNIPPEASDQRILRDCFNFQFHSAFPNPKKIEGYTRYTASTEVPPGTADVYLLERLYNGQGGEDYLIAMRENSSTGASLFANDVYNTPDFGTLKSDFTAGNIPFAQVWEKGSKGWAFIVDGNEGIRTDGSTVTDIGNAAPTDSFNVDSGGAGSINGTTDIVVTFQYGEFGESDPSDSQQITVSDQNIVLSSLPQGGSEVNEKNIYRTDERSFGGITGNEYRLATTIADSITSTTLTTAGDVLVSAEELDESNAEIPAAQLIENYANRMFYAGGDIENGRLIYSKSLFPGVYEEPDEAGDPNVIDSIKGEGERITALVGGRKKLWIFTDERTWILRGRAESRWTLHPVHNVGTLSPKAAVLVEGAVYFVGSDKQHVYLSNGNEIKTVTSGIKNWMRTVDWNAPERFWAIYDRNTKEYRLYVRHDDDVVDLDGTTKAEGGGGGA